MENTMDEQNAIKKSSSTSGESNKWIYLGIFLSVVIICVILYYFGGQKALDTFTTGTLEFMGALIEQSI